MATSALEQTLRYDRLIVAIGIATVVAFSWGYLLAGAGIDMSMADMPMDPEPWSPAQAWLMFAMWWVMMVAMMVPSAAPMILLFAAIKRRQATAEQSRLLKLALSRRLSCDLGRLQPDCCFGAVGT
jgi:predicted metal-binding membrane protein